MALRAAARGYRRWKGGGGRAVALFHVDGGVVQQQQRRPRSSFARWMCVCVCVVDFVVGCRVRVIVPCTFCADTRWTARYKFGLPSRISSKLAGVNELIVQKKKKKEKEKRKKRQQWNWVGKLAIINSGIGSIFSAGSRATLPSCALKFACFQVINNRLRQCIELDVEL